MKVRCPRNQLYDALSLANHAATGRSSLQILSNLYIEAKDDSVMITGSDLEQWIEITVPAMVDQPGKITVPAKLITELIGSVRNEEVDLEQGDNNTSWVRAQGAEYHFVGLPPEEYPAVPALENFGEFQLPASLFLEMVNSVAFAVSQEEARATLTGVKIEYEGGTLKLVATDTHRMAVSEAKVELGSGSADVSAIVPLKAIQLIQRLPAQESFNLLLSDHRAAFAGTNARVTTQLIEGQYPNYQRVIPSQYTRLWKVMTDDFKMALKRAAVVARENGNKVVLRTEGEKLHITARNEGVGEASDAVELVREGDDMEIAFNASYLLDLLNVVKEEGITVELTESLRPVLFKPVEKQGYLCVVMPMAL